MTQVEIRRALKAYKDQGQEVVLRILPDGTYEFEPVKPREQVADDEKIKW